MRLNQRGFGLVETILITLIVAVVGFGGYNVWHNQHPSKMQQTPKAAAPTTAVKTVPNVGPSLASFTNASPKLSFNYPKTWDANAPDRPFLVENEGDVQVQQGCADCVVRYDSTSKSWVDGAGKASDSADLVASQKSTDAYLVVGKGDENCGSFLLAIHFEHYFVDRLLSLCTKSGSGDPPNPSWAMDYDQTVSDIKRLLSTVNT